MRVAVVSDEPHAVNQAVAQELERRGHTVVRFGSLRSGADEPWAEVTSEAARAVASGDCDEGVFFCWSGTGASIAANKVPGVRAALCADAETARDARTWNHANVLVLSNRTVSPALAAEILAVWLAVSPDDERGAPGVAHLASLDEARRRG